MKIKSLFFKNKARINGCSITNKDQASKINIGCLFKNIIFFYID